MVVMDPEQTEIVPDQVEHRRHRALAEHLQPDIVGLAGVVVAEFRGERDTDGDEIVARIEAFGDLADVLAERLAVAHVERAGENVDLRAGVVDVIFLGDPESRGLEQAGERVPTTAPRQWPMCIGPVGLAETYSTLTRSLLPILDRPYASPSRRIVSSSLRHASGERRMLRKPGPAISTEVTPGSDCTFGRDRGRQSARVRARAFRKHHCCIARQVAVRRVARRLDRHGAAVQLGRQHAFGL